QLAPAQHLHQAVLVHQPLGPKRLGRDVVADHARERVEVDHRVLDAERVLEPLELRHPPGEGHLPALEPDRDGVARPLALHAPARGLAPLATDAPTDAPAIAGRPGRRLQIVNLHVSATSSTVTRWGTRAIMPRI